MHFLTISFANQLDPFIDNPDSDFRRSLLDE
jgi:hypothetical protein